jgi:hypothetical protein
MKAHLPLFLMHFLHFAMPNMSFCDLLEYSGTDAVYLKELLRVMRGNGDTRFRTVSKLVLLLQGPRAGEDGALGAAPRL